MNLEQFVSESIQGVVRGLDDAGVKLGGKNVGLYSKGTGDQRHIEFDIAVSASNKLGSSKGGGGGIKVLEFFEARGGAEKQKESLNTTVSRIKFGARVR